MNIVLCLLVLFSTPLFASSDLQSILKKAYQKRVDHSYLRGMAVGVISQEEEFQLNLGDASESHLAFEIGSISKTFTGIAIAMLSLDGKLDLEAPISHYLPEIKGSYAGSATAKQLATHTAKLKRTIPKPSTEQNILEYLQTYVPEAGFPDQQYSNFGFAVLALMIERISGEKYQDYITKNIFNHLSMLESGFLSSELVFDKLLTPYSLTLEQTDKDIYNDYRVASGGIFSTLSDMMKFLRANMDPALYPHLTKAIELSQQMRLGWDNKPNHPTRWKNGAMTGFTTIIEFSLEKRLGAVIMINSSNPEAIFSLADVFLGKGDSFKEEKKPTPEMQEYLGKYKWENSNVEFEIYELDKGFFGVRQFTFYDNSVGVNSSRLRIYDDPQFEVFDYWSSSHMMEFKKDEYGRPYIFLKFTSSEAGVPTVFNVDLQKI